MAVMALFLGLTAPSDTKAATNSDVFRAVNDLIAEVVRLHDANFTDAGGSMIRSEGRLPRHVMQMARTVLAKANLLSSINGGKTVPVPWIPTGEITPTDVMHAVQSTADVIAGLQPIFGVEANTVPGSLRGSEDPDDVYTALYLLSQMIDGLGIPHSVPNDTYQIADAIVSHLTLLARRYDLPLRSQRSGRAGMKTAAVYERTVELGNAIERLIVSRPELYPRGGLAKRQRRPGSIDHEHVVHALNDLLAEVVAMRASVGDRKSAPPSTSVSGMDPSDVYDRLSDALVLVEDLAGTS